MAKYIYEKGFHFVGKFSELICLLSSIENKRMPLREYILTHKLRLN